MRTDPRMMSGAVPFDGKRMIFGGFEPVFELNSSPTAGGGTAQP